MFRRQHIAILILYAAACSQSPADKTPATTAESDADSSADISSVDSGGAYLDGAEIVKAETSNIACPGGSGCACLTPDQCDIGLCIEDPNVNGGLACAAKCVTDCPTGYACAPVTASGGDITTICVPKFARLCDPCAVSKDCEGLGLKDSACVDQGALGRFCGTSCGGDGDCPPAYTCQEVPTAEDGKLKQCVRLAEPGSKSAFGICPCSTKAVQKKLATTCYVELKDAKGKVTGKCSGSRACEATGLTACSAPIGAAEVCDGLDNDCNGQTDEGSCDDKNTCTTDLCDGKGGCIHTNITGLNCDADGSVCTENDSCESGKCVAGPVKDCNDKNACTSDSCDIAKGCTQVADDGKPCDADGSLCTQGDVCIGGTCKTGAKVDCDDQNPCTTDGCDKKSGQCTGETLDEGIPCDDGTKCTAKDTCKGGNCKGKAVDCDDSNPCTDDVCDSKLGCQIAKLSGAPCDDDNLCTIGDLCQDGECQPGSLKNCVSPDDCYISKCGLLDGKCKISQAANGASCDDNNPCTINDGCVGDNCTGVVKTCDDGNNCTDDGCSAKLGCFSAPAVKPCDDGNLCTDFDACKGGACVALAKSVTVECDDGNPCTADGCEGKIGCTHAAMLGACEDGNACTQGDTCQGGVCVAGSNNCGCQQDSDCAVQEDNNLCNGTLFCDKAKLPYVCKVSSKTVVVCDTGADSTCSSTICAAKTGICATLPAADGKACDADGSICTGADTCKAGTCTAGPVVGCDDKNPCTTDSCDSKLGCIHGANAQPCDADGDACTIGDTCSGKVCLAGPKKVCNDDELCTADSCDQATGACLFNGLAMDGKGCDADGNVCTAADACNGGKCSAGKTKNCDDGNVCTDDACDPKQGCKIAVNSSACDDGNACTSKDVCAQAVCAGVPLNAGIDCSDSNVCTTDTCDPKIGCAHVINQLQCDDGNPCTQGDVCSNSLCKSGVNTCSCEADKDCTAQEDGDVCNGTLFCDKAKLPYICNVNPKTLIVCDKSKDTACLSTICTAKTGACDKSSVVDGKVCDADGSVCTDGDACKSGVCAVGAIVGCDDKNPCTADSCDTKLGCLHAANADACDADGDACTVGDVCAGKSCVAGAKKVCDDGEFCTNDSCDKGSGICGFSGLSQEGKGCDADGSVCTVSDACSGGKCAAGKAKGCDDGNICTDDSCEAKTGCKAANNAKLCDDGNACTVNDVCGQGFCAGVSKNVQVDCGDNNICTTDGCDAKTGCTHVANLMQCDDGNPCTIGDVCASSICKAGNNSCGCQADGDCTAQEDGDLCNGTLFCDKGKLPYKCNVDPKTLVVCDSSKDTACLATVCAAKTGSCDKVAAKDGKLCDADGSICTVGDACKGGACAAGSIANCDDGNVCTDDACDAKSGCKTANNAKLCNDGNACTVNDVCGQGFCAGVLKNPALDCSDNNLCTTDGCDAKIGCTHASNMSQCDDGNPCTIGDVCASTVCKPGNNTCGCQANADCLVQEDGDLCNGTLFCDKGKLPYKCSVDPKTLVVCDSSKDTVCLATVCTAKTGSCDKVSSVDGKSCDADGSVCTVGDACKGGLCTVGPIASCDDSNPCTTDSCDAKAGCLNEANAIICDADGDACTVSDFCVNKVCVAGAKKLCDDGQFCTADTCDKTSGVCIFSGLPQEGKGCDADGSVCTVGDACKSGVCAGGLAANCDDKNPCTTDSCDAKLGCVNMANLLSCDADGDACTVGDACASKQCVAGAKKSCDDDQFCTVGSCDKTSGICIFSWLPQENKGCADGSVCTVGDACKSGVCAAGLAVNCDDKNPCTTDGCDAKLGCVSAPNAIACDDGVACTLGDVCAGGKCSGVGKFFAKTYGGATGNEVAYAVAALVDGGFAIAGSAGSTDLPNGQKSAGGLDFYLVRTNAVGEPVWGKTYGGSDTEEATGVAALPQGGFALAGYTASTDLPGGQKAVGKHDLWLVRTDPDGGFLWSKTYGGSGDDAAIAATGIVALLDGGFALLGRSDSLDLPTSQKSKGGYDFWLVRTDGNGNLLWNKTYGGSGDDSASVVVGLSDNGFIVAGQTVSIDLPGGQKSSGKTDFWLVRTDASGNLLWNKTYGGAGNDVGRGVVGLPDGGFVLAGGTDSVDLPGGQKSAGGFDFWLMRTDASGNLLWNKTFGGSGLDLALAVGAIPDGGFVLGGTTASQDLPGGQKTAGYQDFWLMRTDATGNLVLSRTYGGTNDDYPNNLTVLAGGSLALVGWTNSTDLPGGQQTAGNQDFCLLHIDPWGHASCADAGVCASKTVVDCDDKNACTADVCDGKLGCSYANLADNSSCGGTGVCLAGLCKLPPAGMVLIPQGPFAMGCVSSKDLKCNADENPQHQVTVSAFFIDLTEVTVDQYANGGGQVPKRIWNGNFGGDSCDKWQQDNSCYNWGAPGRNDHPINGVTVAQANAFCTAKGGRLPTEAEWEKAARGGCETYSSKNCNNNARLYPWGDNMPAPANYCPEQYKTGAATCPVTVAPAGASPYGLLGMAGNAAEMVGDKYGAAYYAISPVTDPPGAAVWDNPKWQTVLARGGWVPSYQFRSSYRETWGNGNFVFSGEAAHLGFRCVVPIQ